MYLYLAFTILFFFYVFKDPLTLPDGSVYLDVFNMIKVSTFDVVWNWNIGYKIELGYRLYSKLVSLICGVPLFFYFCNALVILTGPCVLIKRYSNWKSISVIFFFLFGYISGLGLIRQFMAYSIIYFALPYVINRDWKKFLLVLFIACNIHNSAFVYLVVYLLYGLSGRKFWLFLIITSLFVLLFFSSLQGYVGEGYKDYLDSSYSTIGQFVAMSAIVLLRVFVMKNKLLENGINKLSTIITLLALVASLYGCLLPGMWYRLIGYFSIYTVFITLPNTIQYINNNIIKKSVMLVFLFIYFYLFYSGLQDTEYEYKLIFDSPYSVSQVF